ncbi:MAG: HEAT repeat domain-containing protein [Chloroflexi bacterium]|nr:HEAT repeat domain-containing protein [Chloroflexota bacterium]MBI3762588.1 HEAT repeat domain-containing protein [Chloroflexota bacterium]
MPDSLDILVAELTSGDDVRAETAAPALAALGDTALWRLRELIAPDSRDADARWWAARTLALIDSPGAIELLTSLLDHPDAELRACAIAGLGERRAADAIPQLIAALADPSSYLARLAGDALVRIGKPAAPDLIRALQESASQQTRIHAARALAFISAPESIPALFRALEDESSLVQYWADEGLDRLGLGMLYFNV